MKINKTALGVVAFVVVLILAAYSAKSSAEDKFHIGIGQTLINSNLKTGQVGYEINNWEFQASLTESGNTKNGEQEQLEQYSVSYLTKPHWGAAGFDPYFRLGISGNSGSELVGESNFMLGAGINFQEVWRLEFTHHSSAGIHDPNTGIDQLTIHFLIPTFW